MKKYVYTLLIIALFGGAISSLLMIDHYYPETHYKIVSCGGDFIDSCFAVNQSAFSTLFGIPLASYGLFFYIFFIFILLVADYAGGSYYLYCMAVLLPLSVAAIIFDIILAIILVNLKEFCVICAATYIINLFLLTGIIILYRKLKKEYNTNLKEIYRAAFKISENSDKKAAYSLFLLFSFFLLSAVIATSSLLKIQTVSPAPAAESIQQYLKEFYSKPAEPAIDAESQMMLGSDNAQVRIIVFSDFLCSACYKFYKLEKSLLANNRGKIKIIYYNYPLDASCNNNIKNTKYFNSCMASRAFITAGRLGFFQELLLTHFLNYKTLVHDYSIVAMMALKPDLAEKNNFVYNINSPETEKILLRDIELAKKFNIKATPTIFINGRRIEGTLPVEIFQSIIETELKNQPVK